MSDDLQGGETGIADELDAEGLVEGIVVEPRRGRLLLFSGGGENYHTPLNVVRGRRAAWHGWFTCAPPAENQVNQ
jgi:hypothetical protein